MPHPEYFEDFWIRCETCHHVAAEPGCAQSCSACHHGSPASIADETLSSKVVIHQSCWECHPTSTGREASLGCALCHQRDARSDSE
jgi:Zn finger protein HypA/HybF involved in hydrogenase expression